MIAFSPDGKTLVSGDHVEQVRIGSCTVRLWEVATGKEIRRLHGDQNYVNSVTFSPDGKTLASAGSDDKTVRLWEVATGKEICRFHGHQRDVNSVAFSPDGKTLVSGSRDTTILVWDVSRFGRTKQPGNLAKLDLPELWTALAGDDTGKAYQAIADLADAPKQAVPFLRERLRPIPPPDPQRLVRLIADLDSPKFAVRQKATEELEKLGNAAEPALRMVLTGKPSLEMRQRVEQLLAKALALTPEQLRQSRAVQALERAGTAEAKQLLEKLAKGVEECRLTQEAKASLDRLAKRR